jgi:ribose transport system ATP-binding protein
MTERGRDSGTNGDLPSSYALTVQGLSKSFGVVRALDSVSFGIERGTVHALLGGNGSGKSTLIKILAGITHGDRGTIEIGNSRIEAHKTDQEWAHANGLRFVHQGVGLFPDMTIADNFALGSTYAVNRAKLISWKSLRRRVRDTLERLDVAATPEMRMGDLSPAMQTMVAVARALYDDRESAVLVLDEPTASLAGHDVETVHAAIRKYTIIGHTVLLVSHRLNEVLEVATAATCIRDGRHMATIGLKDAVEGDLITLITGAALPQIGRPSGRRESPVRLRVENVSVGPLKDVSLSVRGGETLGIAGLAGSGRTTLLQCLFGLQKPASGTATFDGEAILGRRPDVAVRAGIAYLPEDRAVDGAFEDMSVRENLSAAGLFRHTQLGRLKRGAESRSAQSAVAKYGIKIANVEQNLSSLSGGNQQKVMLARWLELDPQLLLLDEPTQGVDVGARAAIHQLIRTASSGGAAVVLVSGDPIELATVCDRVIGLSASGIRGELVGGDITAGGCAELAYGLFDGSATLQN